MAAQRREKTNRHSRYGSGQVSGSVQGNTVRKRQTNPTRQPAGIEEVPRRKLSNTTRKNRDRARYMNMGYVFFLACALLVSGFILSTYLGLQSDITHSISAIAAMERELNDLKLANDEEYNRITNNVDLEEIKRIAIQELGMSYAEEGQIIDFAGSRDDYVRQVAAIPD